MPLFYTDDGFIKAVRGGKHETVRKYMQHGKREHYLALPFPGGDTALHFAAREGYRNTMFALVDGGADVNAPNANNETALGLALRASSDRRREMVSKLLAAGAHPDKGMGDESPLLYALERGYKAIADALLDHGANAVKGHPLAEALSSNYAALSLRLLEAGATLESAGQDPGFTAARLGMTAVLAALIRKGLDVHAVNDSGQTLLHIAAHGQTDMVDLLLKNDVDPAIADKDGRTALHNAAASGMTRVRSLVQGGAAVNAADNAGRTALHNAVEAGAEETVSFLLSQKADATAKDNLGETPITLAKEKGNDKILRLLAVSDRDHRAKTADAITATPDAMPENASEVWTKLDGRQVARVGIYPALSRRLTEIFNFETRALMVITENLKTGAESVTPLTPFEQVGDAALAKALAEFRKQGGKAEDGEVFAKSAPKRGLSSQGM